MNSTKLRIGNSIKALIHTDRESNDFPNLKERDCKIEGINTNRVIVDIKNVSDRENNLQEREDVLIDNCKGIPLNDEYLRTIGINEVIGGHRTFKINDKYFLSEAFHMNSGKYFLAIHSMYGNQELISESLEFVHELQNAIFALTKKEITAVVAGT